MGEVADDGLWEPVSTVTTPGSDVSFLQGSATLYSFSHRGSRYSRCECAWAKKIYRRLFPLGYKKEFKGIIKIAWPIVVSSVFIQLMLLVTFMFVGHLGSVQLDAAALAITITNAFGQSVIIGLSSACDTLFTQTYGSSNRRNLGIVVQKSLIILLLLCIPCWAALINVEHILLVTGQDPLVARLARQYVVFYIPALPANVVFLVLSKYLQAQYVVLPTCLILLAGNVINAVLLTFFVLYLQMELIGASLSLGISQWMVVLLHLVYIKMTKVHSDTWSGWSVQALYDWKGFFRLALPGLFMICLEWWVYEIFVVLAGLLSGVELAAHTVVFQVAVVCFMISLGMSMAANVHVGNYLGEGNPVEAMTAANVSTSLMFVLSLVIAVLLIALRKVIPLCFTNNEEVIDLVISLLPLMALFQVLDALQAVCSGVLRGAGMQLYGAVINLITYIIVGLPLGVVLMFKTYLRLEGMWIAVCCSVGFQVMAFTLRIWFIDWVKEAKLAQDRAGTGVLDNISDTCRDRDISPLQSPCDLDPVEADHIQLSTYSSLESIRSGQSDLISDLHKTLIKRVVFVVCLVIVAAMAVVIDRVLSHLNNQTCFLVLGRDLNLTAVLDDLNNNNETLSYRTFDDFEFWNLTYWFERQHNGNASFTYCNGHISKYLDSSATVLNMSSLLNTFHHRIPHRPLF